MSIVHVWTVLCTSSSIDRDTNNVSLYEVLEQLNIEGELGEEGLLPFTMETVTLWSRTALDGPALGESMVRVVSPSGKQWDSKVMTVDLREHRRLRNRSKMTAMPVDVEGLYWFLVLFRSDESQEWREVARVPLEIAIHAEL